MAALSDRWIVTWMGFFSHDDAHARAQVAFVGADGAPGLALSLTTPTTYDYSPDVAALYLDQAPYAAYRIGLRLMDPPATLAVAGPEGGTLALAAVPNPLREQTLIRLTLPIAGRATVTLYDVGGRCVRRLLDGAMPAGSTELRWDGDDESRHSVRPGVYLLRADTAAGVRRLRIVKL